MDKKLAGLLGVASVLALPAAHASTAVPQSLDAAMQANSYSDLLKPIPNAVELLAASSQVPAESEADSAIQEVQYWYRHHHHHHHWRRRRWHHHHHHHHKDI